MRGKPIATYSERRNRHLLTLVKKYRHYTERAYKTHAQAGNVTPTSITADRLMARSDRWDEKAEKVWAELMEELHEDVP